MIDGAVGKSMLLDLQLSTGDATRFPVVRIYNVIGAVVATLNLASVANGYYSASYTPTAPGHYLAQFTGYLDPARSIPDPSLDVTSEHLVIHALDPDDSTRLILGHLGENVRDDVLSYDVNSRPTAFRRRIFPTAALALSSTPGGSGEGEILTLVGSATHFDAARWATLVRSVA